MSDYADLPRGFTDTARAVAAEGARVGFVTCLRCGATLLLDVATNFDVMERHAIWHELIERSS